MKTTFFSIFLTLLLISTLCLSSAIAQDAAQWSLPDGAKARLGKGTIGAVQFSPDGTRLAVTGSIGVWIYDADSGKELDLLTEHTAEVSSVVYSPDGRTITSGGWDNTVRLWDAETGQHKITLTGHTSRVNAVAYSPDGNSIASASDDHTIRLWDAATGQTQVVLRGHTDFVQSVAYSPDGRTIVSGAGGWGWSGQRDYTVRLWDVASRSLKTTLTGHTSWVESVAYSPDGRTVASAGWDNTVRLWDASTGQHKTTLTGHTRSIVTLTYAPDGRTIASAGWDNTVRLWDATTGEAKSTLTGHTSWIGSVAYSRDGRTLASGSGDGTVRLWDAGTGQFRNSITGHTDRVNAIAYSPDSQTLASGGSDNTIYLWDTTTKQIRATLTGHTNGINSLAYASDGSILASGSFDRTVRLWHASTGQPRASFTAPAWVGEIAYSPDGSTLASGSGAYNNSSSNDTAVHVWDTATGQLKFDLTGHTSWVNSVRYSPDGSTLASASDDGTVRLWDARTGHHKNTLNASVVRGFTTVVYSPDGSTLAAGSGGGPVYLWHTNTNVLKTTLWHEGIVTAITYLADGTTLAGTSTSGTVRLWNTATGLIIANLTGHNPGLQSIAASPDGRTLATTGYDGTILIWDLFFVGNTNAIVRFAPATIDSPRAGEQLAFNIDIVDGKNIAGYQVTVQFDETALRFVSSENGDYLPEGAFTVPPIETTGAVTLGATALSGESSGDGTLATLTFEVVEGKASDLTLSEVILTGSGGSSSRPQVEAARINEPPELKEDINGDGVVNIQDLVLVASNFGATGENAADVNGDGMVNIIDLTLVAGALGEGAAAPSAHTEVRAHLTAEEVEQWLRSAQAVNLTDPTFQRGLQVLAQLLAAFVPKETALLANYPNPFNPETWMPYQLATPADVTLHIYAVDSSLVRVLSLGYKATGIYQNRTRAAYWDGRNQTGEPVASGVYFYTLTAGDFTATRKMLVVK